MSKLKESDPAQVQGSALALVRRTATALRTSVEPSALVAHLNEFLRVIPALRHAWIEVPSATAVHPPAPLAADALALPLRGAGASPGLLRHALGTEPLDASRLQLLGATADLLGAILEHAVRASDQPGTRAMLAWLLEQLPFGAACFLPNRTVLAANAGARVFLESEAAARGGMLAWLPPPGVTATGGAVLRAARAGDRVALVHVRTAPTTAGAVPGTVALFFDLAEKARTFVAAVTRETYRALWLRQPLALAVLAAGDRLAELLEAAGEIGRGLPAGVEIGPLEADAVGLLAPGIGAGALRGPLRNATALRGIPDLRVGLGELSAEVHSPDDLITSAISALVPVERMQKPSVLLCDTSPSVNDSLYVALRAEYDAVRCHERDGVPLLLAARVFDAIFAKVELDDWETDVGFLQRTLDLQPGLKPFVVTDAAGLEASAIPRLPAGTPVFRKPFEVAAVRSAVRRELLERSSAA